MTNTQLAEEIRRLKQETDTVLLAHTYQRPEILDIADLTGDSFALAKAAQGLAHRQVLLCGVRFMAETIKILSPDKEVLLSDAHAGCPMAEQIDPARVARYRREHPGHAVCAYINTTAELKALADVCVTSSSAVKIVSRLPEKDILFLPDKNLGSFVQSQLPDKNIHLLDGFCYVHDCVSPEHIRRARVQWPGARVLIHPECPKEAVDLADVAGSTKELIDYALAHEEEELLFVTERGVYDALTLRYPNRVFHQLEPQLMTCVNMKKTTLQSVYDALTGAGGAVIQLDEELRKKALGSIRNMLAYGG